MVFSLCGVLRLVRFSVKAAEAKEDLELKAAQKKHFTGLPIPAAAAAAVSANLLLLSPLFQEWVPITHFQRTICLSSAMLIVGYLMVCRLKFPSLKVLDFRVPSFHLIFVTVIGAILILYGLLHFFPIVYALISWVYILVALVLSCIRFVAGKKSKTLEDFEPDPDDFEN
jgi:CDP-diacylglycerol--serine O-phosphatidyltransferase